MTTAYHPGRPSADPPAPAAAPRPTAVALPTPTVRVRTAQAPSSPGADPDDPTRPADASSAARSSEDVWDGPLVDSFGRVHRDLRISLTDKCNLRCTYCMPAEGLPWLAKENVLTTDEIERVARVLARVGIVEVRLTGGEPLLRPDIVDVVRRLHAIEGPEGPLDISMTTNAIRLDRVMEDLEAAGLSRLNISLDTVDPERFTKLTRRERFSAVQAGIAAARASGLRPLKINAVAMRGVNDDEFCDLLRFAIDHEAELRFIEQMPLDAGHVWSRHTMVDGAEILAKLSAEFDLEPVGDRGSSPAEVFRVRGTDATVGVIASVTAPFCGACDRVRLTADGQLRNCLFAREESDLLSLLRSGGSDEDVARMIRASIGAKRPGHGIDDPGFLQPDRPMSAIGG
ncbi:GTP 3',8-cyclase MoaA [Brachybacterium sp. MASK1Z-5]|uniref:GTP 3',8-cyclase n=1 Tax=Brachybacterium halotolerans TaxID=2795215 RepID=A0ABS1B6G7_9MICO|nr:GTP 3',8-cyclase MoaA [Brachybacterium halotolerans]MBK0330241.1 GTP 3',8-cyclase MoaA [Brachybacterium halotolerans]